MSSIIIIPARMASDRFPGKPLAEVRTAPDIRRTILNITYCQAKQTIADYVLVATPDQQIADHCVRNEMTCCLTGDDFHTGTERVAAVAEAMSRKFDVYVNWQVDEPTIRPKDVSRLIIEQGRWIQSIGTLYQDPIQPPEFYHNPHRVKIRMAPSGEVLDFSRLPLPLSYEHVGIYTFSGEILQEVGPLRDELSKAEALEQLAWLSRWDFVAEKTSGAISVNIPEDIEALEHYLCPSLFQ